MSGEEGRKTAGLTPFPNARLEPIRVEAIAGTAMGASLELTSGAARVGGEASCELVLDDPAVSRLHALLELLPGCVRVTDQNSRNGTLYLGARIHEARVPIGGSIQIGRTVLAFRPAQQAWEESRREELHGLIGLAPVMRRLFAMLERLGPSEASVLIVGETGSGKEAVARALHGLSPRAKGPFVVLDCAALSPGLAETELFGHAKGAFTGAVRDRAGAFERAAGGTVLLDGVAELPLELQPKLLRALEAREVLRVGANEPTALDVRVIASTHRDLEAAVRENSFRADLFFRLAVAVVEVPPLRARPEDIAPLAQRFARERSGAEVTLHPSTLAALRCDPWPGNVRELRNAVERVLALGSERPPPLPDVAVAPASYKEARDQLLDQFERDYLETLLRRHAGNASAAARASGMSRAHLYRLLERHSLTARGGS